MFSRCDSHGKWVLRQSVCNMQKWCKCWLCSLRMGVVRLKRSRSIGQKVAECRLRRSTRRREERGQEREVAHCAVSGGVIHK